MSERPITNFRPGLEQLEAKRPLSASGSTPLASPPTDMPAVLDSVPNGSGSPQVTADAAVSPAAQKPNFGFLVFRITQPNQYNDKLVPPFGHVLVQANPPVAGQVYNILQIAVRNGTAQTFTASDDFTVKLSGQSTTVPILTGNETWAPGQDFIFFVLTKKYYPLANQVADGYVFDLGGAHSIAIPGPSAIFLRVKYNPATIDNVLDAIVTHGPGAQGGLGIKYGLPDTALYEFLPSVTQRKDFGGYF